VQGVQCERAYPCGGPIPVGGLYKPCVGEEWGPFEILAHGPAPTCFTTASNNIMSTSRAVQWHPVLNHT